MVVININEVALRAVSRKEPSLVKSWRKKVNWFSSLIKREENFLQRVESGDYRRLMQSDIDRLASPKAREETESLISHICAEASAVEWKTMTLRGSATSHGIGSIFPTLLENPTAAEIMRAIGRGEDADFLESGYADRLRKTVNSDKLYKSANG